MAEKGQKEQFGTQSNFRGRGHLGPGRTELPNGNDTNFLVGRCPKLELFAQGRENTARLGWRDDHTEIWSSKFGAVIGMSISFATDFASIDTIIAHSDGLAPIEDQISPGYLQNQLETLVRKAQYIKDDDVSYVEITSISNRYPRYIQMISPFCPSAFSRGKYKNADETSDNCSFQ